MYTLLAGWLITDFSYTTLFKIVDISRRYSISIFEECMAHVSEVRNRSVDYLLAIVDKEMAARRMDMMETKELLDSSKELLNSLVDMATNRTKPVDWDSLEKNMKEDSDNREEFNKVKLS